MRHSQAQTPQLLKSKPMFNMHRDQITFQGNALQFRKSQTQREHVCTYIIPHKFKKTFQITISDHFSVIIKRTDFQMLSTTCSSFSVVIPEAQPFTQTPLGVHWEHRSELQTLSCPCEAYCLVGQVDNYAIECLIPLWLNAINSCRVGLLRLPPKVVIADFLK